jgi:hypothetical protein
MSDSVMGPTAYVNILKTLIHNYYIPHPFRQGSYEFMVQGTYKQIFIKSSLLGCTTQLLSTSNISLEFILHVSACVPRHL